MTDKVEVYKDERGEWRWHRQSENGEIVSTSGEGYIHRSDAINISAQLNVGCDFHVEREEPADGGPAGDV
jgi:uncharacterized protein YegP (UPF0339 family)